MTDVVTVQNIAVPAGNGNTVVAITKVNLGWSDVEGIKIQFPPGCAGLVGVQMLYAGNPVYPANANGYFAFDDYIWDQVVTSQEQGGQWSIATYNMDYQIHGVTVYFSWNYLTAAQQQSATPLVSL